MTTQSQLTARSTDLICNVFLSYMQEIQRKESFVFAEHLKRHNIRFNVKNVIVLTDLYIPIYMVFVASLGPKFSFCRPDMSESIFEFSVVFDRLKERVKDYISMSTIAKQHVKFNAKLSEQSFCERTTTTTRAQSFIELQMRLTRTFLSKNVHIRIFRADKGGKVIVTDEQTYENKMKRFIDSNVNNGIYFHLNSIKFQYVKMICEEKYDQLIRAFNAAFEADRLLGHKDLSKQLLKEPFIISRIYGLFKINKDDYPVRPIISSTCCMGKPLEKWILSKLEIIAERIGKHQIKSARQLFNYVNGKKLDGKGHVLVTWDFDSMFTNIPFQRTKDIIRKFYHIIQAETSVTEEVFLEALTFLVEGCAFFTFKDEIYLQTDGLSMGNSLSQVLAEITTSYFLIEALTRFNSEDVSFIFKYVDDIIGGVEETRLSDIQRAIEETTGMKLKVCHESDANEVDYLQMRIRRQKHNGNSIDVHWVQKEYSSKSILNYHSFHPWNMKVNVVMEFIRNAFSLSSKMHWNTTTVSLRETLRNSNYSCRFTNNSIARVFCGNDNKNGKSAFKKQAIVKRSYIACPYYPGAVNFIKRSMRKVGIENVSLAPSIISNNRSMIFSSLKDKRKLDCITNASFTTRCTECDFSCVLYTSNDDINSTLNAFMKDESSLLFRHHRNTGHVINREIDKRGMKLYKSRNDLCRAKKFCL